MGLEEGEKRETTVLILVKSRFGSNQFSFSVIPAFEIAISTLPYFVLAASKRFIIES